MSTLTDMELIEETRANNMAAFRTLYYRHVDRVFALVTRVLGPRQSDIEDVVQEVFIQAHRSLTHFQGNAKFSTWLHRLALNVCYSHIRRRSRSEHVDDKGTVPAYIPGMSEGRIDARRTVQELYRLIDTLPPKNHEVFVLRELQGLTLAEIAETLEIPLHTAASRLRRGREALMRAFSERAHQQRGEG